MYFLSCCSKKVIIVTYLIYGFITQDFLKNLSEHCVKVTMAEKVED